MQFKNFTPTIWDSYSEPVRHKPDFPFISMNRDMDWLFNHLDSSFFYSTPLDVPTTFEQNHFPKVDVTETKNEFLVSAELPGMDNKDMEVTLDNGTLTLRGEKKVEKEDNQKAYYSMERNYGFFQRSFQVPETIDQNKIDASFSKGVLTVKLPKATEAKEDVKKIHIN